MILDQSNKFFFFLAIIATSNNSAPESMKTILTPHKSEITPINSMDIENAPVYKTPVDA